MQRPIGAVRVGYPPALHRERHGEPPRGPSDSNSVCGLLWSTRAPFRASMENRNPYDQSPLKSQTGNRRGCDDETNDLAWRCCLSIAIRNRQPGVSAARHYQSGLVRPVLSERKLPELRARKPLHELWLAANRTASLRGPSSLPPPLALTPADRSLYFLL